MFSRRGFVLLVGAGAVAAAGLPALAASVPDRYERTETMIRDLAARASTLSGPREDDRGSWRDVPGFPEFAARADAGIDALLNDFPEQPEPWASRAVIEGLYPFDATAAAMRQVPAGVVPIFVLRHLVKAHKAPMSMGCIPAVRRLMRTYRGVIIGVREDYPELVALRRTRAARRGDMEIAG